MSTKNSTTLLDTKKINKIKSTDYTIEYEKIATHLGLKTDQIHHEETTGFKPYDNFEGFFRQNNKNTHVSIAMHTCY